MADDVQLLFLGSGDSQGVPRWWCDCEVCAEARGTGENRRGRPALLLEWEGRRVLVDAPPELRLQLVERGVRSLDAAFLTHTHNDHVAGCVELYDYARWTRRPLPVHVPRASHEALLLRYPWLPTHLALEPMEGRVAIDGATFEAFEVPHGRNGFAHGFRVEVSGRALAYVPDSLDLPEELAERWLSGLDLLVLGTSFWKEPYPKETRSISDVEEALALTARLAPRATLFTHLGHGVDVRRALPPGHRFARDGLEVGL